MRILMLGNSFTFSNDMPLMLAELTRAEDIPHDLTVALGDVTLYMVHNKKEVPADLSGINVVMFGHSHKHVQEEKDGLFWLNPGSCGPRRFRQEITMMVPETDSGQLRVEKITIPHEVT